MAILVTFSIDLLYLHPVLRLIYIYFRRVINIDLIWDTPKNEKSLLVMCVRVCCIIAHTSTRQTASTFFRVFSTCCMIRFKSSKKFSSPSGKCGFPVGLYIVKNVQPQQWSTFVKYMRLTNKNCAIWSHFDAI